MLISKFNAMIRNKFLWGFFAIIVCLAFVGGSLEIGGCGKRAGNSLGTIDGKEISREEFEKARLYEVGFRSSGRLSESELEQLEEAAWKRLATLRYAEKLGIICTKQEITSIIVNDPRFQTNGAFDPEKYDASIRKELGVTPDILEDYMAQEIVLNRMNLIAGNMVLTPPSELQQKLARLTDVVEVDYAFITNSVKTSKIKVSDEELQQYFEKNIDLFRIPEKMNVKYATFPASDYTSTVSITEQDALDYYDDNISDYSSRNTNDELVTVAFTNVREEITSRLTWEDALYKAKDAATELVMDLMPARDGSTPPIDEVLERRGVKLETSPFFSMFENIKGIDAGYDFNRAAFSLAPSDPERSISDAIAGVSNVYVLIAGEKMESRLPAFEEVKEEVLPFARQRKASEQFDEEITELRSDIIEKIGNGKSFRDLLKHEDIDVFSSEPFSVYSDMTNEIDHSELIVPAVIGMDAGETSELITTSDGYLLIHLKSRKPGDLLSAELLKPQLISAVSRYRSTVLFEEMQKKLMAETVSINEREPLPEDEEPEAQN